MTPKDSTADHWDRIYGEQEGRDTSWFQERPDLALRLLREGGLARGSRVLDVGGGTSTLADHLLAEGFRPGVLDISAAALERSRRRLGERADEVEWIRASVLDYRPSRPWDAWHDRALLHFMTDDRDRTAYVRTLETALAPGGVAVFATFGPEGPESCSGLPTRRYSAEELAGLLGREFVLETAFTAEHRTPWGTPQEFLHARFRRA